MFIDVLNRVSGDSGLHATQQRAQLEQLLNQGAREMYHELECSRIYREVSCLIGQNQIVALPSFIGDLRGMRQHSSEMLVPLETMTPRYASDTLGYKWKNWRDLGEAAVHTFPVSVDLLTFETPVLESAIVVVNGKSTLAAVDTDSVTLTTSPKSTVKLFDPAVKSITSVSVRTCDITVKDAQDNEVAILYNNERRTRYKMVDVSELYWGMDTTTNETLVDILYKEPMGYLINDTDSFPAGDSYDEAWHARCMSLHYAPMQGRKDDANRYKMLSLVLLKNIKDGTEYGEIKKVTFGRNKYMDRSAYYTTASPISDLYVDRG